MLERWPLTASRGRNGQIGGYEQTDPLTYLAAGLKRIPDGHASADLGEVRGIERVSRGGVAPTEEA